MLNRYQASDPWLIFNDVEDFIDRELQWRESFHQFVAVRTHYCIIITTFLHLFYNDSCNSLVLISIFMQDMVERR